jgi:hypothetical protein
MRPLVPTRGFPHTVAVDRSGHPTAQTLISVIVSVGLHEELTVLKKTWFINATQVHDHPAVPQNFRRPVLYSDHKHNKLI